MENEPNLMSSELMDVFNNESQDLLDTPAQQAEKEARLQRSMATKRMQRELFCGEGSSASSFPDIPLTQPSPVCTPPPLLPEGRKTPTRQTDGPVASGSQRVKSYAAAATGGSQPSTSRAAAATATAPEPKQSTSRAAVAVAPRSQLACVVEEDDTTPVAVNIRSPEEAAILVTRQVLPQVHCHVAQDLDHVFPRRPHLRKRHHQGVLIEHKDDVRDELMCMWVGKREEAQDFNVTVIRINACSNPPSLCFRNRIITRQIKNHSDITNIADSLNCFVFFEKYVHRGLQQLGAVKTNVSLVVRLMKPATGVVVHVYFNIRMVIDSTTDVLDWYTEGVVNEILARLDRFQGKGSEWVVLALLVYIKQYTGFHGGCCREYRVPAAIATTESVIHAKDHGRNNEGAQACFAIPQVAGLYPRTKNCTRVVEYANAHTVWNAFDCRTSGVYSDVYLKSDVVLMRGVFERFRALRMNTYGLDCAPAITSPATAWNALLFKPKVRFEHFRNVDQLLSVERCIRGDVVSAARWARRHRCGRCALM